MVCAYKLGVNEIKMLQPCGTSELQLNVDPTNSPRIFS